MKKHFHEKRNITFAEAGALLAVREMLRTGLLRHTTKEFAYDVPEGTHAFNMSVSCDTHGCGSVACIGGTMGQVMGMTGFQSFDYVGGGTIHRFRGDPHPIRRSKSLQELFFPPQTRDWSKATNKVAIQAIDNWMRTGKPRWEKLLPLRTSWLGHR